MRAEHLYIHVPFCSRRCVYCDFSIAVRAKLPTLEYVDALAREWTIRHADSELRLSSLYLGGGTPSKLGADVARVMDLIQARSVIQANSEVTMEANPEDVTPVAARAWSLAGINRVSLGVQSFDDRALAWMHRSHDADAASRAIHVLREVGIDNVNIDLIFGLPREIERSWERDLQIVARLEPAHVSVYALTVEPHTPLGRWVARRSISEAPDELYERQFLVAHDVLTSAGFEHYEVSNYGRPQQHSRHNWAYWRRQPYAGLGPSAHEFDGCVRSWNVHAYADWVARLSGHDTSQEGSETLSVDQVEDESTYLGLRTTAGVQINDCHRDKVARLVAAGWANVADEKQLTLTPAGWMRLDAISGVLTDRPSR